MLFRSELAAWSRLQDKSEADENEWPSSPRLTAQARDDMEHEAASIDPAVSREAVAAFKDDDALIALLDKKEIERDKTAMNAAAVLSSTLPGALFATAAVGFAVFLVGQALVALRPVRSLLTPPWAQIFGFASGVAIYLWSRLTFL